MPRSTPVIVLVLALALAAAASLAPGSASARLAELGAAPPLPAPSCPKNPCLAVSRTTGFQVQAGRRRGPFVAPRDGRIVAWTIRLARVSRAQRASFEERLGGEASAGISVLRAGSNDRYRVTGQSRVRKLTEWFGQTVQFPLERSLTVRKGYVVGLTVPTWAPALAVNLSERDRWRASRPRDECTDTRTQTAQLQRKALAQYGCLYRTARLTYSVTLVSTP